MVSEHGVKEVDRAFYLQTGPWLPMVVVAGGSTVALTTRMTEVPIITLVAAQDGGVVSKVLKEEISVERQTYVPACVHGAAVYSALRLLL